MINFYLLILFWGLKLWAGVSLDPTRQHLNALDSKGRLDWADYREDFLISQSAEVAEVSLEELIRRIKNQKSKTSEFSIPRTVVSGDQLECLKSCNLEKCDFKLHLDSEIRPLVNSKDKAKLFTQFVEQRLKDYINEKKLKGYETRLDNVPYVKKAFGLEKFLKASYPKSYQYLMGDLWTNKRRPAVQKNRYIRSEVIHITGDKMQPVYRLSENIEFEEKGYLNVEIHIYTNHFFDSSIRIYEAIPWPPDRKKSVYIVTDFMEVDELKKSELIRTLFKTPMEEAIAEFRKSEMKELR